MAKITELVIKYKQDKNQKILKELLNKLEPQIRKKSTYIYFKKWYPLNYFSKCKYCQHCKKQSKDICQECNKCICERGYFNLNKNSLCDFNDVKNDLILKILELIEQFDIKKDFYTFFGSILFEWRPSFITKGFIQSISHKKIYEEISGEEKEINLEDKKNSGIQFNLTLETIFKQCDTETEKQICQMYLDYPGITEEEIGKKLGMTRQNISLILQKLRQKLKITKNIT